MASNHSSSSSSSLSPCSTTSLFTSPTCSCPSFVTISTYDSWIIGICLFLSLFYHLHLYIQPLRGKETKTQLSLNIRNSIRWIVKHKEKGDSASGTLAIQTLRNTMLVAIFVGGNAFAFTFSLANTIHEIDRDSQGLLFVRSIILISLLTGSFLCWACVIRFISHMGYLVGTLGVPDSLLDVQPEDRATGSSDSSSNSSKHGEIGSSSRSKSESDAKDVNIKKDIEMQLVSTSSTALTSPLKAHVSESYYQSLNTVSERDRLLTLQSSDKVENKRKDMEALPNSVKERIRIMSLNMLFFR